MGVGGQRGEGGEVGRIPVYLTQCAKLSKSGAAAMQQETGGNDIWSQGIAEAPHLYIIPHKETL